jgi:hypothetical protein
MSEKIRNRTVCVEASSKTWIWITPVEKNGMAASWTMSVEAGIGAGS